MFDDAGGTAANTPQQELSPRGWAAYMRALSAELTGAPTLVRCGRELPGARAVRLPLREIGYDGERDLLQLALGGSGRHSPALRCFVDSPQRIVSSGTGGLRSLLVEEAHGAGTVIEIGAS